MVSCTEIVKRRYRQLLPPIYQLTKIYYRTSEEYWDPKTEDLEPLKVTREIPHIDILLKMQSSESDGCDSATCDKTSYNVTNSTLDAFLNINAPKNDSRGKKFKVFSYFPNRVS